MLFRCFVYAEIRSKFQMLIGAWDITRARTVRGGAIGAVSRRNAAR